ncbi:protein unc-79 homolog [Lingula anatina]|uniref:Protein unc-79 homolog n=1 Tax=Lingula anatina TaxID=7574 RepID=A0A1S3H1C4_LINAN|nr:protein unc-79 homolog [Lingula anatina]|eukprot:XP_013379281.1 protein unc-79 homolog [Lingula anatina]
MGTRAASFTAKIRILKDYQYRVVNNLPPVPTGTDVANTLKYFSQALLGVLKEVPSMPTEIFGARQRDSIRLSVFPNLNYSGLYYAVMTVIDIVPMVQIGQLALAEATLHVLCCLVPFLEYDLLDSLPYTVASTLACFPASLQKETILLLCTHLLPLTLGHVGMRDMCTYATDSVPAIIMLVFQYTDKEDYHTQLLECLMSLKKDISKDLLNVIAYGPPASRAPAANLLFRYWPQMSPNTREKKGIVTKVPATNPFTCQRELCPNARAGPAPAIKLCIHPAVSVQSGRPPPLYICQDCMDILAREHSGDIQDMLLPMEQVSSVCENKNCASNENLAVCTCFHLACASYNGNRPIRFCASCHVNRHYNKDGQHHVVQSTLPNIWGTSDQELQHYMVEAIVSLLKEAQPPEEKKVLEASGTHVHASWGDIRENGAENNNDDRKILSRYGIWLLVEFCKPKEELPIELLARLLGMLFQWFKDTTNQGMGGIDGVGSALEKLKAEYIYNWLQLVNKSHFEIMLSCLLPHPVEYARVGGPWDTLANRTTLINNLAKLMERKLTKSMSEPPEPEYELKEEELPPHLQLLHALLKELYTQTDADVLFYVLKALRYLCLHAECLNLALKDNEEYVKYCLKKFLIIELWKILQAEHSQLASICVPILLHCLTLPTGSDIMWRIVEQDFQNEDWRARFSAVEKVSVLLRYVRCETVKENQVLLTTLAHAFCHLIESLNDINCMVAQKTKFYLETQKKSSIKCLCMCLEFQFDSVINDRTMILQRMQILSNVLPDLGILSWEFFLHRFDALSLEAQIDLESSGDISHPTDLVSSDRESEHFLQKLNRARFALARTDSVRSVSASLYGNKPPFRKASSMPLYGTPRPGVSPSNRGTSVSMSASPKVLPKWKVLMYMQRWWLSHHQPAESTPPSQTESHPDQSAGKMLLCRGSLVTLIIYKRIFVLACSCGGDRLTPWLLIAVMVWVLPLRLCFLYPVFTSFKNELQLKTQQVVISFNRFWNVCDKLELSLIFKFSIQITFSFEKISNRCIYDSPFNVITYSVSADITGSVQIVQFKILLSNCHHFIPPFIHLQNYFQLLSLFLRTIQSSHLSINVEKPCIRQQSAPQFGRRGTRSGLSIFGSYMLSGVGGYLREFTDQQSNFSALLQKAMDLEGVDRETVHKVTALLMKFMMNSDQDIVSSDKEESKYQDIVLRHLNVLLGYNQSEKAFSVPPYKLRCSATVNAFLAGLPHVLDRNFELGNTILPVAVILLQYVPSPQRYASDYQPPNYTLWYLEPHTRQAWLTALLVILYKYSYNKSSPNAEIIEFLVQLAINTVYAQQHRCKTGEEGGAMMSPLLTRNASNVSTVELENIEETDTPPQSPTSPEATVSLESSLGMASISFGHRRRGAINTPLEESPSEVESPDTPPKSDSDGPVTGKKLPDYSFTTDETQEKKDTEKFPAPKASSLLKSPKSGNKGVGGRRFELHVADATDAGYAAGDDNDDDDNEDEMTLEQSFEMHIMQKVKEDEMKRRLAAQQDEDGAEGSDVEEKTLHYGTESHVERKMAQQIKEFEGEKSPEIHPAEPDVPPAGAGVKEEAVVDKPEGKPLAKPVRHKPPIPVELLGLATRSKSEDKPAVSVEIDKKDNIKGAGPDGRPSSLIKPDKPVIPTLEITHEEITKPVVPAFESAQAVPLKPTLPAFKAKAEETVEPAHPVFEVTAVTIEESVILPLPKFEVTVEDSFQATVPNIEVGQEETPKEQADKDEEKEQDDAAGGSDNVAPQLKEEVEEGKKVEEQAKVTVEPEVTKTESVEVKVPDISTDAVVTPSQTPHYRQRRGRKTGLATIELQKIMPELAEKHEPEKLRRRRKADIISKSQQLKQKSQQSRFGSGEQPIIDRCPECKAVLEQYDEDTISLCIVCMEAFVHREPSMSAPYLLDMLQAVTRIAANSPYPWQNDWKVVIPGSSVSVARQFLRCVLHQLAPNGIFPQLFQSKIEEPDFMKTLASALMDFNELNCYAALQHLLEGMNNKKTLPQDTLMQVLNNLSSYMECIPLETTSPTWPGILGQFEGYFRKLLPELPVGCDIAPVMKIMASVLKIPGVASNKGILEPFSKVLSFAIQNCELLLQHLIDICSLANRVFIKERDKVFLARTIVFELVQALKFRASVPDSNLLLLVQFVCIDAGGTITPGTVTEEYCTYSFNPMTHPVVSTSASECMKQHLNECVDFIADLHTLTKVKNNMKGSSFNLNEDTLGNQLKSGIAQYIALEFTRGNGRDNRAINRYLPWLYHPPSAMQQGPKEFIDCITHIRLLSWLLLGSLTHTAITQCSGPIICQPIPLEASQYIADHILVIMTGFAEQSKASVLHMSSLFHAFILCQLWTMYCESLAWHHTFGSDTHEMASETVMDFWGRVTPGILQLLSHSRMMAEMVNLHFLSMMEALQECNSSVLSKLFALWTPIFHSYHGQLPGHIQVRLQTCQNWAPPKKTKDEAAQKSSMLLTWLKRLQFKLGQTEIQSSSATQFYAV